MQTADQEDMVSPCSKTLVDNTYTVHAFSSPVRIVIHSSAKSLLSILDLQNIRGLITDRRSLNSNFPYCLSFPSR